MAVTEVILSHDNCRILCNLGLEDPKTLSHFVHLEEFEFSNKCGREFGVCETSVVTVLSGRLRDLPRRRWY